MSNRAPKVFVIEIIVPPAIVGLYEAIKGGEILRTTRITDASAASQFSSKVMTISL